MAPNQRGSDGYGTAFRRAAHGAWAGPDLADVRHLARTVRARRGTAGRPAVIGFSYGAFLALLAAGLDADLWSRCAAIAAFLSGPRLYTESTTAVRTFIDRHGGRCVLDDIGSRDVQRVCDRMTVPVLLVHGERDDVVPVTQSRTLYDRLHRSRVDVIYREVPGAGHSPLTGNADPHQFVADFLRGGQSPGHIDDHRPGGAARTRAAVDHDRTWKGGEHVMTLDVDALQQLPATEAAGLNVRPARSLSDQDLDGASHNPKASRYPLPNSDSKRRHRWNGPSAAPQDKI